MCFLESIINHKYLNFSFITEINKPKTIKKKAIKPDTNFKAYGKTSIKPTKSKATNHEISEGIGKPPVKLSLKRWLKAGITYVKI